MPLDLEQEMAALGRMKIGELADRFAELFGYRSHSNNRKWLTRRIAWKLQEREYGGISERSRRRAEEIAANAELRVRPPNGSAWMAHPLSPKRGTPTRDPRLPAHGTQLVRVYQGQEIRVNVLESSFEFEGRTFKSLSAIATEVTGTRWNGMTFFGLGKARSNRS